MEKEFVTYEVALKLKKLGFDGECFGIFSGEKLIIQDEWLYSTNSETMSETTNAAAPLWQQALDFLREKFMVHISVTMVVMTYGMHEFAGQEVLWRYGRYIVNTKHDERDKDDSGRYKTYHEALEAGILDAIELINNQ